MPDHATRMLPYHAWRERDHGRPRRDRVPVGPWRADGARHDRRRPRVHVPASGGQTARPRGRRADRQHQRRLPRGRRCRRRADRDGGRPRPSRRVGLTADDDAVWGLGLGCNGAIEVFIEPADRAAEVAHALRAALEEEHPISVVTVLESATPTVAPGARIVVRARRRRRRLARRRVGGRRGRGLGPRAARGGTIRGPARSPATSERSSRSSNPRCGCWCAEPATTPSRSSAQRPASAGTRSSRTTVRRSSPPSASPRPRRSSRSRSRRRWPSSRRSTHARASS